MFFFNVLPGLTQSQRLYDATEVLSICPRAAVDLLSCSDARPSEIDVGEYPTVVSLWVSY